MSQPLTSVLVLDEASKHCSHRKHKKVPDSLNPALFLKDYTFPLFVKSRKSEVPKTYPHLQSPHYQLSIQANKKNLIQK